MKKPLGKTGQIARSELIIFKVLWMKRELSARDVHAGLVSVTDWAYSTTRTNLDRMARKGLLRKRASHGMWMYSTALSKVNGWARVIRDLADRVFEVDSQSVVALLAESNQLTREEVEELSRLLEQEGDA